MSKTIKVLVVDDSALVRQTLTDILTSDPEIEVIGAASDPYAAVKRMETQAPDVITLDIEMPRMDGYELATHMRNDPRLRDVPIIMITSRSGEKHRQRAFEIGVDRYLGKPYQEADLMRNVDEILKVHRGDRG